MAGRATPATVALQRAGVAHRVLEYHHDPDQRHFGQEAVAALGLDADRTFKTLIALAAPAAKPVCALVPVSVQLDLKALAVAAQAKQMAMTDRRSAERATGYLVGAISPHRPTAAPPHLHRCRRDGPPDDLRQRRSPRPGDRAVPRRSRCAHRGHVRTHRTSPVNTAPVLVTARSSRSRRHRSS